MTYAKSLKRERTRAKGKSTRAARLGSDGWEDDFDPDVEAALRTFTRERNAADKKLRAAMTRDPQAIASAELDN